MVAIIPNTGARALPCRGEIALFGKLGKPGACAGSIALDRNSSVCIVAAQVCTNRQFVRMAMFEPQAWSPRD